MTTHPPAHHIRCPWCGATPGNRCTTPRGRKLATPYHDARHQAAAAQDRAP